MMETDKLIQLLYLIIGCISDKRLYIFRPLRTVLCPYANHLNYYSNLFDRFFTAPNIK